MWGRISGAATMVRPRASGPMWLRLRRAAAGGAADGEVEGLRLRNIGISAHIDSGKTTLTERVLFYTGRIREMHEVKGKDGVGAVMDSMDLEREKGITIKSAATYARWGDHSVNIIDTPGHVDFTIEVERALRVLDGAVLVLCGVAGVQSQTLTVDRQMRRYGVPRLVFINKLDRMGANPWRCVELLREKLSLTAAAMQVPIGLEGQLEGVVDLVAQEAVYFEGPNGERIVRKPVPDTLLAVVAEKRAELIETLCEVDDEFAEGVLFGGVEPTPDLVRTVVRRATIAQKFCPVFMGSAYKNKGVQELLNGVSYYLPSPLEVTNIALDLDHNEDEVRLSRDPKKPLVMYAFKLEESRFGQLTYVRVYQGTLKRGDMVFNVSTGKKVKVPRVIRMHANDMEEVTHLGAGEIGAIFGVECSSGTTFTDGLRLSMTSMFVPDPVVSLAVKVDKSQMDGFTKALQRFMREDPTFRVHYEAESNETIISGMGELHLEIYVERMAREYNVKCTVSPPRVSYRESVTGSVQHEHTHKKQSGGAGQYARVIGMVEPTDEDLVDPSQLKPGENCFVNNVVGGTIPPEYIPAIEKGFDDVIKEGPLTGNPLTGVTFSVSDGAYHAVDSSELAFRICTQRFLRSAILNASPIVLEPLMAVEVTTPAEYQTAVSAGINKRKGFILTTDTSTKDYSTMHCEVPLSNMFGYATDLRSSTQGKGEFAMEYIRHVPVSRDVQKVLQDKYAEQRAKKSKEEE
jgi:elongation factor G